MTAARLQIFALEATAELGRAEDDLMAQAGQRIRRVR